jgi:hypothetical protein
VKLPAPLGLVTREFFDPAPESWRYLSRSAFHVDAGEPAVAHAVLDQPHNALATRALERADIEASVDGFECNGDALHTARETAWQQPSNFHYFLTENVSGMFSAA